MKKDFRVFDFYRRQPPPAPPAPPLRVWARKAGEKLALFEVSAKTRGEAIAAVRGEGYPRAVVEVK